MAGSAHSTNLAARRAGIVCAAIVWALAVVTMVSTTRGLPARPVIAFLCIIPGSGLFTYVILYPSNRNIICRSLGLIAGVVLFLQASNAISRGDCSGDGLCATMIFNGTFWDVAVSVTCWGAATAIASLRRRRLSRIPHG